MFLFHRNNTGGGASGEQRGRGVGMFRMLIVLIVLIVLIAHISMVMNFSPVLQPPLVLSLGIQHCSAVAAPPTLQTPAIYKSFILEQFALLPGHFSGKGEKGRKKNCEKDFCSLAVLESFKLRTVTTPLS